MEWPMISILSISLNFSSFPVFWERGQVQEDNAKVKDLKVQESRGKGKLGKVLRRATA